MSPYSPTADLPDKGMGDAELGSNVPMLASFGELGTDGANLLLGQLGTTVGHPLVAFALPPFGAHVGHVLLLRSQPEMRGIDAMRCVADVHNDDSCWDFHAVAQFVGEPMSEDDSAGFVVTDPAMAACGFAIPRTLPEPAFIRSSLDKHAAEPLGERDTAGAVRFEHAGNIDLHVRMVQP